MGLLNLFNRSASQLQPLPKGSFTVDNEGRVLASTLPQQFPIEQAEDIANEILDAFRSARAARIALRELVVHFANLKLTARELRGGAIIFLAPKTLSGEPG